MLTAKQMWYGWMAMKRVRSSPTEGATIVIDTKTMKAVVAIQWSAKSVHDCEVLGSIPAISKSIALESANLKLFDVWALRKRNFKMQTIVASSI